MLAKLLQGVMVVSLHGNADASVQHIVLDSRKTGSRDLFIAAKGTQSDGHAYIGQAVSNGVSVVVCETLPEFLDTNVTYVQVADSMEAAGIIAANFYDNPSRKLRLVGITGTNGKTTTVNLLYQLFRKLGYKVGLISTVVYCIHDREIESTHTTPDSIRLNAMLAEMVEAGCEYCFMEVSSHALVQHRTAGLQFSGGLFSNITHDHLDYHHTFAEYIKAKKSFFDKLPSSAFALVNTDDRNGSVMVQNTAAKVYTYSVRSFANFQCKIMEMLFDGMLLNLDNHEVWVKFLGRFNAYNLTCVYGAAVLLGADRQEVLQALSGLGSVNGRFEYVRSATGTTAIVDYAHTPDALQNVINTINEIRTPEQKLFVVVGCGGNRDAAKRPKMAKIAAEGGDMAVLTSDNPRLEDPEAIMSDMKAGLDPTDHYLAITNRREAIKTAVTLAGPQDIILIAGKGHETYQDVGGVKHHFDDKEEVSAAFGSAK